MFVFPAPRPRIFHRKTGGSSPFPLENWLFWASPPSPQHFRVRNENRPFSFLQFWRIGLPAPAAASGPAPLDMDPPRTGDRPPGSGYGAVRSAGGASGALLCVSGQTELFLVLLPIFPLNSHVRLTRNKKCLILLSGKTGPDCRLRPPLRGGRCFRATGVRPCGAAAGAEISALPQHFHF